MQSSLLIDLLIILRRYWRRFAAAFFMVLVSNCLLILNPLIFRQAVMALDPASESNQGLLSLFFHWLFGLNMTSISLWTAVLILVAVTGAYFKYLMRIAFIAISRDVESEVRSLLFQRIQKHSLAFFDRHQIGEIMSRLTNDISAYRDVLGPGIMYPLYFLTLVIPALFALFSISPILATLSLIPILVLPLLVLFIENYVYKTSLVVQQSLGSMSTIAHEDFSGIRIVKSYVMESTAASRFHTICQQFARYNVRLACYEGMFFPFLNFLTKVITIVLVLLSGFIILKAWGTLSVADFVSFMWIQSNVFGPVLMLGWVLPMYIRGKAAYDRIFEIYQVPLEISENVEGIKDIPSQANIRFENLTFSYQADLPPAISKINLEIKAGSFVGITGAVGAGKSTLFRLLAREYEVPKGMIFIGDKDLHEYNVNTLRKTIVTVEQNPFLFSKTIAENVSFARSDADVLELESVARFADLHETIISFPEKYNTMVGERGVTLSGGQKQRIAVARAFLSNRAILLLDDIFSALDFGTEKRIFEAMKANFKGKTVLLITHRVSVLEQTDRVLYMAHGTIVEDGNPQILAKQNGYYAALTELQRMQEDDVE